MQTTDTTLKAWRGKGDVGSCWITGGGVCVCEGGSEGETMALPVSADSESSERMRSGVDHAQHHSCAW